jgi:hypothetical protein
MKLTIQPCISQEFQTENTISVEHPPKITKKEGEIEEKGDKKFNFENLLAIWGGRKPSSTASDVIKSNIQIKSAGNDVTNHSKPYNTKENEVSCDETELNYDWPNDARMGNSSK